MEYKVVETKIEALVGKHGLGTIVKEVIVGDSDKAHKRITEMREEYGGFFSSRIYEKYEGYDEWIKVFDSNWN